MGFAQTTNRVLLPGFQSVRIEPCPSSSAPTDTDPIRAATGLTQEGLQCAPREDGNAQGLIWESLNRDKQGFSAATDAAARCQSIALSGIFGQGHCQC
jgi:hypothetical protein